ncbi:hypothetical protein MGG_02143 [Pyricularia oryzae 70-15]|uniref:Uncharacterized protein n=3 Tax=Pyricularia oryzae TaxID=318829 RepID=G4MP48_PYRO7|nr:uncharacterized protein MGG_02143 [Pyricularia oryzae 70-15]EHA56307.1 hypothetical protein MGG_02143 [Pyricularia oryzae 70-15]ELQ42074.1 hypothetical protein OOU_Y34scaffold00235g2 [Pyricularia oryzae Y34]
MSHQNKMTHAEIQQQLRKLSREFSRDAFGTFFSGALALFMPWLCGSAVFSFAGLVSKIFKLRDLVKDIKARGYAITKTSIFIGLIEGAALKLFTTIVTLGHDDLMVATGRFIQSLKQGVDWLKDHASIEVPHIQALSAAKVGELDERYRMSHPTIEGIAEGVSKPVEKTQELLGLDTAKVLASPGTGQGWHADGTKVVEQVLVAGAVQVATEKIVDAVTQKPYDACVDRRHKK